MIDDRDVERIARRVVELLEEGGPAAGLVDAVTVAARLGVDVGWVYEHAARLGARRLGDGPRARLRFSLAEVDRVVSSGVGGRGSAGDDSSATGGVRRRRRRAGSGTTVPLLPIRGEAGRS